ncbi:MAG: ATP-binding protein [Candidatus Hodarchaeales archaeon]
MLKIAVASGKGGTGKTTVAINLSLSLESVTLVDCDVEEPNVNLFLDLDLEKKNDVSLLVPVVDESKCTHCGICAKLCQYNALAVLPDQVMVFEQLCHGCGLCELACPEKAIHEKRRKIGTIERGRTEKGLDFVQGTLNIGEAMAVPVIAGLKKVSDTEDTVILDVPPGSSCPVIEAVKGVDYCILVTEPTPFGEHDLRIAVDVMKSLKIPFGVVINRDGVGDDRIEKYCQEEGIPVLMRIPHDERIMKLYARGIPFVEEMTAWKEKFRKMYSEIRGVVNK